MPNIAHVITGLEVGGAEAMLLKLLSHSDRSRYVPHVFVLRQLGAIGRRVVNLGIPVTSLNVRGPISAVKAVTVLARELSRWRADLVHTWMYHADLVGGVAALLADRIPTLWTIRQSGFAPQSKLSTKWIARACAVLSRRIPKAIVSCSERARETHIAMGYRSGIDVIPNGFDVELFRPDKHAREALRRELKVGSDAILV